MTEVTDEILAHMVDAIVEEADPEQIYLFGSRARGDSRADSDTDLLIVAREPFGPSRSRWQILSRLWQRIAQFRAPVDIVLYSREEVERWRRSMNHVIADALREGRVLYERH